MTILFELITPQHFIGGAGEYIRSVFYGLLKYVSSYKVNIKIVALVDTRIGKYAYSDLTPQSLSSKGVEVVDYNGKSIGQIIEQYKIDKFFFGCGQYMGRYSDIVNIQIPGVIVIHDLLSEEYKNSHVNEFPRLPYSIYEFNRSRLNLIMRKLFRQFRDSCDDMRCVMALVNKNKSVQLVTVSEYTRSSISFNFNYPIEKIPVLYSCERNFPEPNGINDPILGDVIQSNKKYFLMLSANRIMKNAKNAFTAFRRFIENGNGDFYLLTTGCKEKKFDHHISLNYLSENDLVQTVTHCYALLFPSFFEGFGYPPVEAMRYGKPVLSSNVTSMPEILGDAPLYFSPIYPSDIYRSLNNVTAHYDELSQKSLKRYSEISRRQQVDLEKLIRIIVE